MTLRDGSPARGPVTRRATSPRTQDPPPPVVSIERGELCGPRGSADPCANSPNDQDCTHPSCGRVHITLADFTSPARCTLRFADGRDGGWGSKGPYGNGRHRTSWYNGNPNISIRATCDGVASNVYNWPGS